MHMMVGLGARLVSIALAPVRGEGLRGRGPIKALLRELRSGATRQPGFISGQTVVDAFSPIIFMTISRWSTMAVWDRWEKDPERSAIIERIDALLQRTPKVRMWLDDEDAPAAGL